MRPGGYIYLLLVFAFLTARCKKPYAPPAVSSSNSYLVVEGVINAGADSTIIKLNRTVKLSGNVNHTPEVGARVTVEGDQGIIYQLVEAGGGVYVTHGLNLDNSHKYHLHIVTAAGKEYLSDYEAVKPTPPIDSVGYNVQANGIQLYVNSHDPNNNTRYYRWDYVETWQFHAKYQTPYITNGRNLVYRRPDQQIFTCFAGNVSSTILLGSSIKLINDEIFQQPVIFIESTSEKIEAKYSILVKEYALTKDAYNFWQNMKKNSEQLGSIFDAQPSEIPGNVRCITDPSEAVIGYVTVTNIQQKRIFIANNQLASTWLPVYPYECQLDTVFVRGQGVATQLIPIDAREFAIDLISKGLDTLGYLAASAECADCTIRGTTKQPAFWK